MTLTAFTKPRFLLCEGDDDKGFFESLILKRNLPDFQVCHSAECNSSPTGPVGGKPGFSKSIKGMEVLSGFRDLKALLLVTDNDDLTSSFKDAQKAFTENGHVAPTDALSIGSMFEKPVAILMIPRDNEAGDLETLCLPAIYEKWPLSESCTRSFLNCTGADKWGKKSSINKARARSAPVGFYEPDPYKGIGHLFRNSTLSVEHACFNHIADFLSNFDGMCGVA